MHPIQEYVPDYRFCDSTDTDEQVSEVTYAALVDYFNERLGPDADPRELIREVALTGAGVIDAINLVGKLSSIFESSMIPTGFEHRVLISLTRPADPRTPFEVFDEVARFRLPRLRTLPWAKVIELRHHKCLVNFRATMSAMQNELKTAQPNGAHEAFREIERKSLKELLALLPPTPLWSVLKGIATNLPLSLPVNPLALLDSLAGAAKQRELKDQFGWIYFLHDLDD